MSIYVKLSGTLDNMLFQLLNTFSISKKLCLPFYIVNDPENNYINTIFSKFIKKDTSNKILNTVTITSDIDFLRKKIRKNGSYSLIGDFHKYYLFIPYRDEICSMVSIELLNSLIEPFWCYFFYIKKFNDVDIQNYLLNNTFTSNLIHIPQIKFFFFYEYNNFYVEIKSDFYNTYFIDFTKNTFYPNYQLDLYYEKAIHYILHIDPTAKFHIFTEKYSINPSWYNKDIMNIIVIDNENSNIIQYIFKMAQCSKGGIGITNNSSWLSGYINNNADKCVLYPTIWNKSDLWNGCFFLNIGKPIQKMIYEPSGGLGDSLIYSTIPELYTLLGYEIYTYKGNPYRNEGIKQLVWDSNPFIKGELNKKLNKDSDIYFLPKYMYSSKQLIKNLEKFNGVYSHNKYPKIYYKPKEIVEIKNNVFLDISSITRDYTYDSIISKLNKIIHIYKNNIIYIVTFKHINNEKYEKTLENIKKYYSELGYSINSYELINIFSYCDVINSCLAHISLHSGSNSMASAIKQDKDYPKLYCLYFKDKIENDDLFIYENVEFIL